MLEAANGCRTGGPGHAASMATAILLLSSCLACGRTPETPMTLNVLFIGNSYTFDLPETVAAVARANGRQLQCKAIAKGGWTLDQHAGCEETLAAIRAGNWDYVVLQEQSQIPSFPEPQRVRTMIPAAERLAAEIRKANAEPLFYLTWGRRDGDTQNVPEDTFERMQERLREGYAAAARACDARIVPAGEAWARVRKADRPDITLYHRDGSHPSSHGLYLNACLFYRFLFRDQAQSDPKLPAGLSEREATFLRETANAIPFSP